MSTSKLTKKQSHRQRFMPDIQLTKENGFLKIVDGPPAALKDVLTVFPEGQIPLLYSSVIGTVLTSWMEKGYSFAFWENES